MPDLLTLFRVEVVREIPVGPRRRNIVNYLAYLEADAGEDAVDAFSTFGDKLRDDDLTNIRVIGEHSPVGAGEQIGIVSIAVRRVPLR